MTEEFTIQDIGAIGLFILILSIGIGLWISPYRIRRVDKITGGLTPWKIPYSDFGIWAWGMFVLVFGTQLFVFSVIPRWFPGLTLADESGNPTVPGMFLAALTLQVPMLLFFFGSRIVQPNTFRFPLSSESLSLVDLLKKSFYLFFLVIPLVWGISLGWSLILELLETLGLPANRNPQELVETVAGLTRPLEIASFVFLAVVLAPLAEELVFRAGIYRFLKGVLHPAIAVIVSGLLFALLHHNLVSFVPLWFLGAALAVMYEVTGNIRVPILVHAIFNFYQLVFIFLHSPDGALP